MVKCCKLCKIVKPVEEFHTCGKYKDKQYYRGDCIECCNDNRRGQNLEYQKEYRNRPEVKVHRLEYRKSEKSREYDRQNDKKRYDNDPVYKLKKCIRARLKYTLKASQFTKTNKTEKYIGCSYPELKKHIEDQFYSGMTWENHGILWQIEHIKALGFANTEEELYKLSHYSNIRPMLITEHTPKSIEDTKQIIILRKANKIA